VTGWAGHLREAAHHRRAGVSLPVCVRRERGRCVEGKMLGKMGRSAEGRIALD